MSALSLPIPTAPPPARPRMRLAVDPPGRPPVEAVASRLRLTIPLAPVRNRKRPTKYRAASSFPSRLVWRLFRERLAVIVESGRAEGDEARLMAVGEVEAELHPPQRPRPPSFWRPVRCLDTGEVFLSMAQVLGACPPEGRTEIYRRWNARRVAMSRAIAGRKLFEGRRFERVERVADGEQLRLEF